MGFLMKPWFSNISRLYIYGNILSGFKVIDMILNPIISVDIRVDIANVDNIDTKNYWLILIPILVSIF